MAGAQTAPSDTNITQIPDLTVTAPGIPWGDGPIADETLRDLGGTNLAEAIEHLPGLAAVRRAPSAAEPVIRGLGWERVQTILGAVPLYGACPGRMDPPATYLTPLSMSRVSIFRSGGLAAFGPGATGGAIYADPDFERPAGRQTRGDPLPGGRLRIRPRRASIPKPGYSGATALSITRSAWGTENTTTTPPLTARSCPRV